MNKIIIFLVAISIGLAAQANYTVQTYQQYPQYLYPTYPPHLPVVTSQSTDTTNLLDSSSVQTYVQPYNQGYNPYQIQENGQYINPYRYQRGYGYGNSWPSSIARSAVSGLGNTNVKRQVVKSILYSMMGGY